MNKKFGDYAYYLYFSAGLSILSGFPSSYNFQFIFSLHTSRGKLEGNHKMVLESLHLLKYMMIGCKL